MISSLFKERHKFFKCFLYSNIHEIPPSIEKITLSYVLRKDVSLKILSKILALFELITDQRGFIIRSKKSSIRLKLRKGVPIGMKITLRKRSLFFFFVKFLWEILPNINSLSTQPQIRFTKSRSKSGGLLHCLIFCVNDPLIFPELQDFFFVFKKFSNTRVLISFLRHKQLTKYEIFLTSRLCKLPLR